MEDTSSLVEEMLILQWWRRKELLFGMQTYLLLLFLRVLLSWFPAFNWERQPWLTLRQMTDPYLQLFRGKVLSHVLLHSACCLDQDLEAAVFLCCRHHTTVHGADRLHAAAGVFLPAVDCRSATGHNHRGRSGAPLVMWSQNTSCMNTLGQRSVVNGEQQLLKTEEDSADKSPGSASCQKPNDPVR